MLTFPNDSWMSSERNRTSFVVWLKPNLSNWSLKVTKEENVCHAHFRLPDVSLTRKKKFFLVVSDFTQLFFKKSIDSIVKIFHRQTHLKDKKKNFFGAISDLSRIFLRENFVLLFKIITGAHFTFRSLRVRTSNTCSKPILEKIKRIIGFVVTE